MGSLSRLGWGGMGCSDSNSQLSSPFWGAPGAVGMGETLGVLGVLFGPQASSLVKLMEPLQNFIFKKWNT